MFQLVKNIKIVMILMLVTGCSLSQVESSKQGELLKENVKITMPRLNPVVGDALKEANSSRAYYIADKLVLKAYDVNSVLVDTFIYDLTNDFIAGHVDDLLFISLILPVGDYTIEADVYNYNNSTTAPVVSGVSNLFTVIDGQITSVEISMTPNQSEIISRGESYSLTSPKYTDMFDDGYIYKTGAEYWFKYTANSDISVVSILSDRINYLGDTKLPFISRVFDSNGCSVIGEANNDGDFVFSSFSGEDYFVLIIPVRYNNSGQSYFSNSITFSVDLYTDQNVSEATAELLDKSYLKNGLFSDLSDFDYYRVNLTADTTYIFESWSSVLAQITDSLGVSVGEVLETDFYNRKHVRVYTSGDYYLRIERSPDFNNPITKYDFVFQEFNTEPTITPSNNWVVGDVNNDCKQFYKVIVDPTKKYSIRLDNGSTETGLYSSDTDIETYTYSKNPVTNIVEYKDNYIASFNSYFDPLIIEIPIGCTEIIIEVSDYMKKGGTFAFQIQEYIPPTP